MSDLMLLSDIEAELVNGGGLPYFPPAPKPCCTTVGNIAFQRAKIEQNNIALGVSWVTNQYNSAGITQTAL